MSLGAENIYEQTACAFKCVLIECKNYKHCGQKRPKWLLEFHKQMCINCAAAEHSKTIVFTDIQQECPVCYEEKYMIQLPCKHLICLMCLYAMFARNENTRDYTNVSERTTCPFCRGQIHNG